jgi:hypothetical protein
MWQDGIANAELARQITMKKETKVGQYVFCWQRQFPQTWAK